MRSIPVSIAAAGFALALGAAGAAGANGYYYYGHPAHYVTTYRPVTRYVRRTVVVPERVWRPVTHRVHYYRPLYVRRVYVHRIYEPPVYVHYRPIYAAPYYSYAYRDPNWDHRWGWEHRRWEHERHWGDFD